MKYNIIIFALINVLVLTGCNSTTTQTALQIQSYQKREFETNKAVLFAATLSVLQDFGYIIEAADVDTGLITGSSPTQQGGVFMSKMRNTKVTAFVESFVAGRSSCRLNFVKVTEASSSYGMRGRNDKPVQDPAAYNKVFDKIADGVFVRKSTHAGETSSSTSPRINSPSKLNPVMGGSSSNKTQSPPLPIQERQIYIFRDGKQSGPYNESRVREEIKSGEMNESWRAWHEGLEKWSTLKEILAKP